MLSRLRATRPRAGHRLDGSRAGRGRASGVLECRGGDCRDRADQLGLRTSRASRRPNRSRTFRRSRHSAAPARRGVCMSDVLRIAQIAPLANRLPPPKSGSVETITWLLTEGLVARGHDVTLFAAGDSNTTAKLDSLAPHGYHTDLTMWPWEMYDLLNLAAAVERASDFDIIHFQAEYYPMSLPFTRL